MVDAFANREPSGPNGVTVDRASLTYDALSLRTLADAPFRARLEDTGNAAAIKVAVGVGVLVSEAGRLGGHPLVTARERTCRKRQPQARCKGTYV